MCGCKRKAGPGNKRTTYSPSPVPTKVTATNALQMNQKSMANSLPINNAPMALNQNVNITTLNNTRSNILRRNVYEQARIKALKK